MRLRWRAEAMAGAAEKTWIEAATLARNHAVCGRSGFAVGAAAEQLGEEAKKNQFDIARATLGSAVGAFGGLTSPVLAYASDLFSSNQNAAAARYVAGGNKAGGTASGIMSTIGSIAMAAGTAY